MRNTFDPQEHKTRPVLERTIPSWITGALVLTAFGVLYWLEGKRPLRRTTAEPKAVRNARNLAVAGLGALAVQLAEAPLVAPAARLVERRRWGLLKRIPLPIWIEVPLALVLLDYTLYVWHVLVHRAPWLWRFHAVHHIDLDLDASTALRFHFGELTVSAPWRLAQIFLIGVAPLSLSLWQTTTLLSILFHHANVELPPDVERRLGRVLVTPRMHGIHHSIIEAETNSNWSSGLSIWDRLHGTLQLDIPQASVTIGIPAYREPDEVTLPKILALPFARQRPSWRLPNGETPDRILPRGRPDRLMS